LIQTTADGSDRRSAQGGDDVSKESNRARWTYLEGKSLMRVSGTQAPHTEDDVNLIARMRAGDKDAMAAVYDRYRGVVYGVALRVLGNTTAAEDVLQEVFLRLWRNPNGFDAGRGKLPAWLAVIARNRSIDYLRKRPPEDDIEEFSIRSNIDLEDGFARMQAVARIRDVISHLPQEQRKSLEMVYFEGMTQSEIAARTGEPLGTIKTRIRTGLLTLRKAFE
jgi:RNA polymerase sigma-70 factor (ECF subfamily)